MGLVTKHAILAAIDWDFDEFEVPKWGTVRIKALSAAERLRLVKEFGDGQLTPENAFAFFSRLIAMSIVNADGGLMFDPENTDDIQAIQTRSWDRLQFVADKILQFNGMENAAAEGLEKN